MRPKGLCPLRTGPLLPYAVHVSSTKSGGTLASDWSFNIDDTSAHATVPPDEVRLPVQQAANEMRQAMDACRSAAPHLGAAVRTSGQAGYGTKWILEAAGLSSGDLERVLRGEELY